MSEVPKKKKKKRHHSGSSSDIEVASKRIKVEISDTEHNDSLANSSQANDQLCYPELRFQPPTGFAEVHPSSSNVWWEDIAGKEHKELWLIRAPADCTSSTLNHCSAVAGQTVQFSRNEGETYSVTVQEPNNQFGRLVVLLPSKYDHRYRIASPICSIVTVTKNIFNKPDTAKGSPSKKKEKKHKHAKHDGSEHIDRNSVSTSKKKKKHKREKHERTEHIDRNS